jgi:hypothetical protein
MRYRRQLCKDVSVVICHDAEEPAVQCCDGKMMPMSPDFVQEDKTMLRVDILGPLHPTNANEKKG